MGTLLNRRRYMGGKGIEYLEFEDPRMWELVTYCYGDVVDMRGKELANGELEGDDNTQVTSDYVFARGHVISAHKDSRGTSIAQKAARTVDYRVELEVISGAGSGVPWNLDSTTMGTADTPIFQILEETGLNSASSGPTATTFANVLSDGDTGWGSQSVLTSLGDNKWYADFTSTVNTNYLRVAIRAASGVTVKWSLIPLSTSTNECWQPLGITKTQCEAVTTFGNTNDSIQIFRNNHLLTKFNEFQYFNKITNLWGNHGGGRFCNFLGCNNLAEITFPESLTDIGDSCFRYNTMLTEIDFKKVKKIYRDVFRDCHLKNYVFNEGFENIEGNYVFSNYAEYIDFPSTTTNITSTNFWSTNQNKLVVVCRATTPPTSGNFNSRIKKFYVPAESIEDYKNHQWWSQVASKTYQIEGTWYETHRSLDPNEP